MKNVNAVVKSAIRSDYAVQAVPRLIADWNLNRYAYLKVPREEDMSESSEPLDIPSGQAGNLPSETYRGFDPDMAPVSSIGEPWRPTKGIAKALIGQSVASELYQSPHDPKFYVADPDDKYKYWISPVPTDATGVFPLWTQAATEAAGFTWLDGTIIDGVDEGQPTYDLDNSDGDTMVRPHIIYPEALRVNKIVVKLENTWATPDQFQIMVMTAVPTEGDEEDALPMSQWTAIADDTNTTVADDGTITIYYQSSAWTGTRPTDFAKKPEDLETTNIYGLMLRVVSMKGGVKRNGEPMTYLKRTGDTGALTEVTTDGSNSNLALIALEPHMEVDLTGRLISVDDTFDMGESSQFYPIGTLTSNEASLSLSNDDGLFNNENSISPFYKILEPNVEFNLEYIYTVDDVEYPVQQFHMYGENWGGQAEGTVSLMVQDASKFLKFVKPLPSMYEGKSSIELVWRILDSVGFIDYEITEEDIDSIENASDTTHHVIPVFWTDGEKTAWEVLDEIARGTQTAIYFDGNGKLQVRTRDAAFSEADIPDWTLHGERDGTNLADIAEDGLTIEQEYEANIVNVAYKTTKWKVGTTGQPALSKVWEPDTETLALRSAKLQHPIIGDTQHILLKVADSQLWPYSGKVNIDGEIMEYEGKQYRYYKAVTNEDLEIVHEMFYADPKSDEERKKIDQLSGDIAHRNHFTGALKIKKRGIWNSEIADHTIDFTGWTPKVRLNEAGVIRYATPIGWWHNKRESSARIDTPWYMDNTNDMMWAYRGREQDTTFTMYGTKMKFNSDAASTQQVAGIAINLTGGPENGYYIELTPTSRISAATRKNYHEICIRSWKDGKWTTISKGAPLAVIGNRYYEIDVTIQRGVNDVINVWVNGRKMATAVTTASTKTPVSGRFAMYARGKTNVDYEYIYALRTPYPELEDDFGFNDLKSGGVRGGFFIREAVYQAMTRWKWVKKGVWRKENFWWNRYIFDEFGPYVHEIREFDVKFDPMPVQYATLFSTNYWATAPVAFTSTPTGAKFIMANISRENAILHGEDASIYGADRTIAQALTVLGRNLEIAEDAVTTVKNEASIRKRGPIEVEISSDWIQSENAAKGLGAWIAKHWSEGVDQVNVEIFGNPLIEIGDVVDIHYPRYDMFKKGTIIDPTLPVEDQETYEQSTHRYFVVGTSTSFEAGMSTSLSLRRIRIAHDSDIN